MKFNKKQAKKRLKIGVVSKTNKFRKKKVKLQRKKPNKSRRLKTKPTCLLMKTMFRQQQSRSNEANLGKKCKVRMTSSSQAQNLNSLAKQRSKKTKSRVRAKSWTICRSMTPSQRMQKTQGYSWTQTLSICTSTLITSLNLSPKCPSRIALTTNNRTRTWKSLHKHRKKRSYSTLTFPFSRRNNNTCKQISFRRQRLSIT